MLLKGSYFHSAIYLLDFGNQIQLEITVKVAIFRFKRFYRTISYFIYTKKLTKRLKQANRWLKISFEWSHQKNIKNRELILPFLPKGC